MKGQHLGIRRDKDAVSFIESDAAAVVGNGPAAIDTEQHTERNTICPVVYFLPPFGIDDHSEGQDHRGRHGAECEGRRCHHHVGSRLNDEFEKNIDMDPLAETWECSTHPDGPSYVVGGAFDGQELAEVLRAHPEYLGERHKGENALPILIKFIDAKKDLSVQVHPTDAYAQEHENGQLGKTEMWYVLDAGRDAKLVYGLKQNCTKAEMRRAIADGTSIRFVE